MKYEQKFGVMIMVCALLTGVLAVAISEDWNPRFDTLQNILMLLRVKLFPESDTLYGPKMIDVPTKYVLVLLLAIFAYGFTTYLEITPAWKQLGKVRAPAETAD